VAIFAGVFGDDRQTSVPKTIRSLREFTRVLARGGVRVAKPLTAPKAEGQRGRWSPARFVASD
jgi:hypothetical protein